MEKLKLKFAEWDSFVDDREKARKSLMNPPGVYERREEIRLKQAELFKVQAELQKLKAELVLSGANGVPYNKAAFDHQWVHHKRTLKAEVEALMAEEIEKGTSIPRILKALDSSNPAWLYRVKDNLNAYRGAAKEEMAQTTWYWTDVTGVHRYGLGHGETGSDWGFVLMHGAVDSEFEHEKCMFEFNNGTFIGGNRQLFDSVATSVKRQRADMLAQILDGVYVKKVRRDVNPYFDSE